jgi:hypothetical protein
MRVDCPAVRDEVGYLASTNQLGKGLFVVSGGGGSKALNAALNVPVSHPALRTTLGTSAIPLAKQVLGVQT